MTLRIPKPGTGSAWSRNYWNPPEHPAVPLLLSLRPATRRWLFGVPGAGVGFYWTRTTGHQGRDTAAEWGVGDRALTLFAATGSHEGYGLPLPDDADVDRALWLPGYPWAVLEALEKLTGSLDAGLKHRGGHTLKMAPYSATLGERLAGGDTAIEAVLRLADRIVGGGFA